MSVKKIKKAKHVNLTEEVENVEAPVKSRKRISVEVDDDLNADQVASCLEVPSKNKKKSKVSEELNEVKEPPPLQGVKKKKKKKDEEVLENGLGENNDVSSLSDVFPMEEFKVEEPASNGDKVMSQDDLIELITRIEKLIPPVDALSFRCRLDKLDWNEVVFGNYTVDDCKTSWNNLQKNIRRFRLLREVLQDAREHILNPPKTKKKLHPDMPDKPISAYKIFYKRKMPAVVSRKPGMDIGEISRELSQMYKNLSQEKREKYEKMAEKFKLKYEEDLKAFYNTHPEIKPTKGRKEKVEAVRKPKNPVSPFLLYFENQLRKHPDLDKRDVQVKQSYKEKWKNLSDKKKLSWISKAEEDILRYEEEVKKYMEMNPSFAPVNIKHILSKEDLILKDRLLGKPDKPPNSAYALFSRNYLQSDEIKKINAKDRMNFIANKWKECSEEAKSEYKKQTVKLMDQYRIDYEKYLESLPEDKKQLELSKNPPKKKKGLEKVNTVVKPVVQEKIQQPSTPPMSAFRYFANTLNVDDKAAKKAWKELTDEKKEEYEKKLVEIKRQYMLDFERFLNSLTKDELEKYSKTRQEVKVNADDFPSDSTSSSSEDDTD